MILKYTVVDNKYVTLKQVLKNEFHISKRLLIKLKSNNCVLLNNESHYLDYKLKLNDVIEVKIDFDESSENIVPNSNIYLDIIYEDEYYIIVNKQPGIPVHPSQAHYTDSLSNAIQYYFDSQNIRTKIRPVNRLDKDTSGIVIFAKNEYIQECLIRQMKDNLFKKEYIAILSGNLDGEKRNNKCSNRQKRK